MKLQDKWETIWGFLSQEMLQPFRCFITIQEKDICGARGGAFSLGDCKFNQASNFLNR